MQFRHDINGLRAIAVVVVVLFHFGVPGFQGGFVGVDIFFVISGYLMTGIILTKIQKNQFSVIDFYIDRGRRIIPALAALCFCLLIFGWFFLTPTDYRSLGMDAASSIGFLSNAIYYMTSGNYFSTSSHEKWLLHTWSLSVEWQFYLIYPLVILSVKKALKSNQLKIFLGLLTVISFCLSIIYSEATPSASFYLLHTRAWEMLLGGLVFLSPNQHSNKINKTIEMLGLALVLLSVLFLNEKNIWPGYLALIPTIGTALIIWSARSDSFFTNNPLSLWLGRNSYSIYLWHWPIAVFIFISDFYQDALAIMLGLILSLILGCLSFKYIELIPLKKLTKNKMIILLLFLSIFVGSLGVLIYLKRGVENRLDNDYLHEIKKTSMPLRTNGWCFYSVDSIPGLKISNEGLNCNLGNQSGKINVLLIGDSYAGHWEPFWDYIGERHELNVHAVTTNWCYASFTENFPVKHKRSFQQCLINRDYFKNNINSYDLVIISGLWVGEFKRNRLKDIKRTIDFISDQNVKVVVMPLPVKYDFNIGKKYLYSKLWGTDFKYRELPKLRDDSYEQVNSELNMYLTNKENSLFVERRDVFSLDGGSTVSDVTLDNLPFSFDGGHISIYGSQESAKIFEKTDKFSEFLYMLNGNPPHY